MHTVRWIAVGLLAGCASSAVPRTTWTAPDGSKHQAGREADAYVHADDLESGMGSRECDEDSDCDERSGGVCITTRVPAGYSNHSCRYDACRSDADCKGEALCVPAGVIAPVARCVRASCRSNADCGGDGRCRMMLLRPGSDARRFGCVGAGDPCDVDRPCPPQDGREQVCIMTDEGARCELDPGPPP
jgi:hypothetical protein